jgi:proline iminopeptidase
VAIRDKKNCIIDRMRRIITLTILFLYSYFVYGGNLYSKAFGNSNNPAIIFIHGGPSGNSTLFEATTAQQLADKGFYVVIYDRRGEGRSIDTTATFTYQEAINDLNLIYETYNIKKAIIIAHSFGGLVATLYSESYPMKVNSLILAGALFSQQETYDHILTTVKEIYKNKEDTLMLAKVSRVKRGNKNSAEYRKDCYDLAWENDFFKMPSPTEEAREVWRSYEASIVYKFNIRNYQAPLLFYKNESKNNINIKPILRKLKKSKVKLYAIYGKQDGIFSTAQLKDLEKIVGKSNFLSIDNCSHYLFVDQQKIFLKNIINWLEK